MSTATLPSTPGITPEFAAAAGRIRATPEFAQLAKEFHPLAGQIVGDRQYFFEGGATVYPWADEPIHAFTAAVQGAAEPQEIVPFLRAVAQLRDDAVMFELGAGWGFYSIVAARRLARSRHLLIEANPRLLDIARRNIVLNELTDRAEAIHAAACDRHGEALRFREAGYGSYLDARRGEYAVTGMTVDGIMRERGFDRVDMLHMDVQNAEESVLVGAADALARRAIRFVFIGTHTPALHAACTSRLVAAGYRVLVSIDVGPCASGDGVLVAEG